MYENIFVLLSVARIAMSGRLFWCVWYTEVVLNTELLNTSHMKTFDGIIFHA